MLSLHAHRAVEAVAVFRDAYPVTPGPGSTHESAPWVDGVMWAQSPSILWPDDHSWVVATEIDVDSTLIRRATTLIHELMQTPGLEVLPIRTDADLSWDGDLINRPE